MLIWICCIQKSDFSKIIFDQLHLMHCIVDFTEYWWYTYICVFGAFLLCALFCATFYWCLMLKILESRSKISIFLLSSFLINIDAFQSQWHFPCSDHVLCTVFPKSIHSVSFFAQFIFPKISSASKATLTGFHRSSIGISTRNQGRSVVSNAGFNYDVIQEGRERL